MDDRLNNKIDEDMDEDLDDETDEEMDDEDEEEEEPDRPWTAEELINLAKWQKNSIRVVLLRFLLMDMFAVLPFLGIHLGGTPRGSLILLIGPLWGIIRLAVVILSFYCIYMMAKATKHPAPIIFAFMALLPLASLFILIFVSTFATKILKCHDIKVGLMGADQSDLDNLKYRSDTSPVS